MKTCGGMEVQLHSFLTSLVVGVNGQLHVPAALLPREESTVPIEGDAGWAPASVWTFGEENFNNPAGVRTWNRTALSTLYLSVLVIMALKCVKLRRSRVACWCCPLGRLPTDAAYFMSG